MKKYFLSLFLILYTLATRPVIIRNDSSDETKELDKKLSQLLYRQFFKKATGCTTLPEKIENEFAPSDDSVYRDTPGWKTINEALWLCAQGEFAKAEAAGEVSGRPNQRKKMNPYLSQNCENLAHIIPFLLEDHTDGALKEHAQKRIQDMNAHNMLSVMAEDVATELTFQNRAMAPVLFPEVIEESQESEQIKTIEKYVQDKFEDPTLVLTQDFKKYLVRQEERQHFHRLLGACCSTPKWNKEDNPQCKKLKSLMQKIDPKNDKYFKLFMHRILEEL